MLRSTKVADDRAVALAEDEVAFPIAALLAIGGSSGPLADQRPGVDEAGGALADISPTSTCLPAGAQRSGLTFQAAAVSQVDRLVDGLVGQVALWLVGERGAQRLADLLGAPVLVQPLLDVRL